MSKNVENVEDLDLLNVPQLREFLEVRGVRQSGNRALLLQLATLYFRSDRVALKFVCKIRQELVK